MYEAVYQFIDNYSYLVEALWITDPVDSDLLGSSVHGILLVGMLEWIAMASSRGSSRPRDQTHISYISCIGRRVLYHLEKETATPLQYSCLENSMDRGAWQATVHGVAKSQT